VPVAFVDDEPTVAPRGAAVGSARHAAPHRPRWLIAASAAAAFAAVAAWLALRVVLTPAAVASVAVLPFENLSTDADQRYFADGITEELINTLTRIRDLKVTGRASAFRFDATAGIARIGSVLGVSMCSSVRRSGDDVRVGSPHRRRERPPHLGTHDGIDIAIQDSCDGGGRHCRSSSAWATSGAGGMTHDVDAFDDICASPASIRPAVAARVEHLERAVAINRRSVPGRS
jgi:hypothetical protein